MGSEMCIRDRSWSALISHFDILLLPNALVTRRQEGRMTLDMKGDGGTKSKFLDLGFVEEVGLRSLFIALPPTIVGNA